MSSLKQVYFVTGAGSGFGATSAKSLALEGHTVYAGLFSRDSNIATQAQEAITFSAENNCDLRTVPIDLTDQTSVNDSVAQILKETNNQLDVIVHNAGHMNFGPSESFTPEQLLALYDINAVGMHRLNIAVLPHFRAKRAGHLIYISSSAAIGARSPFLGAYFAAKSAMDTLAQVYARELHPWGIETTIVVPGIFGGTNHFQTAMQPGRPEVVEEYDAEDAPSRGLGELTMDGTMSVLPKEEALGDPKLVADKLVEVSRVERGSKPFRVFVDPIGDGAEEVGSLVDSKVGQFFERLGLARYLKVWL